MCNEFTQIHNIEIDNNIFNNKIWFFINETIRYKKIICIDIE